MDLTPESETYRAALSSAIAAFFGHHVRVGAITHFNAETVKQLVRDMCEPAYRAGREDAAKAIEAVGLPGDESVWRITGMSDLGLPEGQRVLLDRDHAAGIARGNQPRTPVADVTPGPKAPPTDTSWIEIEGEWGTR